MANSALRNALEHFGLSQVEFAELLSVTPRTVNLWMNGETQLPGPVIAYLRVLKMLGPEGVVAELHNLDRRKMMILDGIYKIDYEGADGIGDGMLVLKDGNISGTDVGGAQYDGRYKFNEVDRMNILELTLEVPPNLSLVTGDTSGPHGAKLPLRVECGVPNPRANFLASVAGKEVSGVIQRLRYL